jgi:hypothetical protein
MYKSNKIFSSRADEMVSIDLPKNDPDKRFENEMVSMDLSEIDPDKRVESRRPDRIIGFQETRSFSRRLERYDLMAGQSENEAGGVTLWETVESTVLNHKGNSLLFPFLIIEAKKRHGAPFEYCNLQTAAPILKMLKMQEDLQKKSNMTLEYGGPLVWYIAYRGEDWRLSGCYVSDKPDEPLYASSTSMMVCDTANLYQEIVTLWTGQLNDIESALQFLLIIDYIFDWARDIYKPSLISQLNMLASEPSENDGHIHDDLSSRIDTDSDIYSLRGPKQPNTIEVLGASLDNHTAIEYWGASLENDTDMVPDEERILMNWATYDSGLAVLRPACIVQNLFRCLFVTKANIDELFSAVHKPYTVKQLAKYATNALDNLRTVLVSEDVLDSMEEAWTNRVRRKKPQHIPESRLFASIVYHTVVTRNWELQRIIFCLAFDEEALCRVKNTVKKSKSAPYPLKNAQKFGKGNAEGLISALKDQSIQKNLASALASTRQELRKRSGSSIQTHCPTFEFADITYYQNGWNDLKTYELIDRVYHMCKKNSEEPTESFLRVSHQWNSLTDISPGSNVASYFPNSEPAIDEQYILVAQNLRYSGVALCIYGIPGRTEAPEQPRKILQKVADTDVLYKCSFSGLVSNNWKDVYKKWRTTDSGSCQEFTIRFQQWRDGIQDEVSLSLPMPSPSTGPVVTVAESNLKRHRDDADKSDVLTVQKKVKYEIIIIDD